MILELWHESDPRYLIYPIAPDEMSNKDVFSGLYGRLLAMVPGDPSAVYVPVGEVWRRKILLEEPNTEQLIADFRGGIPANCDFCNQPMNPETAVAEEAGQWACAECWQKFEANDELRRLEGRMG